MLFHIQTTNGLAIYDQIVRQIKFAVANETLLPGHFIPSVRELARDLAVNPNTVARAYRELQAEGIVAQIRGTGLEVTQSAPKECRQERLRLIRERLRSVLLEARHSHLTPEEIEELMEQELKRLKREGPPK